MVSSNDNQNVINKNQQQGCMKRDAFKPVPRFTGRIEELSKYIYDRSVSKQSQAEEYIKITCEIASYAGGNFDYGKDIYIMTSYGT